MDAEVAGAQEPGTLRFDVWEVLDEPDAFYLYEAYADQTAFDAATRKANPSRSLWRRSSRRSLSQ
jgi:quinol monooxygenase YgiN